MFSCLVDLHWLISACESAVFFGIIYLRIMLCLICVCFVTTQTSKNRFHPKITLYSLDLVFLFAKKHGAQKTGGFPSPVPYMTLHLANVSPDRLPTAHTCGLQLDLYLGLLLKHETVGTWEENVNTKPGFTRLPCPRIHVWNIYLHMYGKCNCL